MMVMSRVSIFVSPEGVRMSNSRSFPACTLVAIPGVVVAAALEFERSMMRVSFENSVNGSVVGFHRGKRLV
jgi:hypothetical protein